MGFFLSLLLFIVSISYASPFSKRPGRIAYELKSSFLSTSENLDDSGDIVDIPNGNSVDEIKTNLKVEYDYSRFTTFYSDLVLNAVESSTSGTTRSETALSDIVLGFEYVISRKSFLTMPSFQIKIPLSTYSESTDSTLLNNNAIEFESLLHLAKRFKNIYLHGYGGFTYRDEGLSWLLPLGAEVIYIGRRFSLGGGVESFFSVTDDDYTSDSTRRTNVTDRVMGGSLLYNSVNPSITKVAAFFKYYIEPQLFIGLGVKQPLFGESAAYGTEIYANLGFAFGGYAKKLPNLKSIPVDDNTDEFEFKFENDSDRDADVFNKNQKIEYRESVDDKLNNVEQDIEIKLKKSPKRR